MKPQQKQKPQITNKQPFQDPNATKKKYTEANFGAHVLSTARSLVGSTLFGVCMTVGLHIYKGMVVGLAMQAIMGPLNLAENPLVKALFLGSGQISPDDKLFDEKAASELTADDEVVDESGNPLVRNKNNDKNTKSIKATGENSKKAEPNKKMMSLEEVMLDTWDSGDKADISNLMSALTEQNCNHQTKEDQWTTLMILAGLGQVKGTASAIRQALKLGANAAISDKEGWNALHWAAFHGSPEAAKELAKDKSLLETTDKEGITPLETAKKEKNEDVVAVLEEAEEPAAASEDGPRKRK